MVSFMPWLLYPLGKELLDRRLGREILKLLYIVYEYHTGKLLSGALPIQNGLKQGDVLSLLLFTFALEYAIRESKKIKPVWN